MFGAIEWKSVNKSTASNVWDGHEYGQSGTRFYQPQTQNDGWAMKHHLTRARHKWMTDVGQIAGSLDPVVRPRLSRQFCK